MPNPLPDLNLRRFTSSSSHDPPLPPFTPRHGKISDTFVSDRSCNSKKFDAGRKPLLGAICSVFQALVSDRHTIFGNGISLDQAKVLAALAKPRTFRAGEVLCVEGANVSDFVVVIRGRFSERIMGDEYQVREMGSVINEVGLLGGLEKGRALITCDMADSVVASIPYHKFHGFLEKESPVLRDKVLDFVRGVLFPELMAIEASRMSHASAVLLQCAMRQYRAARELKRRRTQVHLRSALIIQRIWRKYVPRLAAWRVMRRPFGLRLQCAVRTLIARRKAARQQEIKDVNAHYLCNLEPIIAMQILVRMRRRLLAVQARSEFVKKKRPPGISRSCVSAFLSLVLSLSYTCIHTHICSRGRRSAFTN